jgi:predicted Zn-dependent protease with MMP-like domain
MRPKLIPLLERCIENGTLLGYRRAFKHTENPTEEEIVDKINDAIINEIYEWFDFSESEE